MTPPNSILTGLESFRPEFNPRTWVRLVTLILGTILARGRRTVTAALRQMGLHNWTCARRYHQTFNRSVWSPRRVARRLLSAAIAAFAIDETRERRWGKKIRIRGHYRDPLASSKKRSVSTSGIRWIVLALVVTTPGPASHGPCRSSACPVRRPRSASSWGDATRPSPSALVR